MTTPTTNLARPATRAHVEYSLERHGPVYAGYLSNHLPMALLALDGLGASQPFVDDYFDHYVKRLKPLDMLAKYPERLASFRERIAHDGVTSTLHATLPPLMSGWYRDAYHPFIRLAYGVHFDIPGEVAAGLAYLDICGANSQLAEIAHESSASNESVNAVFQELRNWHCDYDTATTFSTRADTAIGDERFRSLPGEVSDTLRTVTRVALDIFASTHDFFALHLVTGAHAYRILFEYAGADRDRLFLLGVAAGYLAVNTPAFTPLEASELPNDIDWLALCRPDEHDYKLTYSALDQAQYWNDPSFASAAYTYLSR